MYGNILIFKRFQGSGVYTYIMCECNTVTVAANLFGSFSQKYFNWIQLGYAVWPTKVGKHILFMRIKWKCENIWAANETQRDRMPTWTNAWNVTHWWNTISSIYHKFYEWRTQPTLIINCICSTYKFPARKLASCIDSIKNSIKYIFSEIKFQIRI